MQREIHTLKPPLDVNSELWLGFDEGRLVAVVDIVRSPRKLDRFHLALVAVDVDHRGQDGELADELLAVALDKCALKVADLHEILVTADIHRSNACAQEWAKRNGFHITAEEDDAYQTWILRLILD